jgi:hypothetical protein
MISIPPAVQYLTIVILSFCVTFAGYEVLKRIPVIRSLFGIAAPTKTKD